MKPLFKNLFVNEKSSSWWIFLSVTAMTMICNLDVTIINLGVAKISIYFHASIREAQWMISVFLFSAIAVMLFFGRLADIYGKKNNISHHM